MEFVTREYAARGVLEIRHGLFEPDISISVPTAEPVPVFFGSQRAIQEPRTDLLLVLFLRLGRAHLGVAPHSFSQC